MSRAPVASSLRTGLRHGAFEPLTTSIIVMPKIPTRISPEHHAAPTRPGVAQSDEHPADGNQRSTSKAGSDSPSLTMDNDVSARAQANEKLALTRRDLMRVRHTTLSAEQEKTYQVARGFARDADAAMRQKRYLIAAALAQKASSLASNLAYRQKVGEQTTSATNALGTLKAKLLGNSAETDPDGSSATSAPAPAPKP